MNGNHSSANSSFGEIFLEKNKGKYVEAAHMISVAGIMMIKANRGTEIIFWNDVTT